jgi:hypothetical protein
MKRLCLLAMVLVLAVMGCQQPFEQRGTEAAPEAVSQAEQKTAEVLNLVVEGKGTGDFARLEAYLAQEDPDGEVRALLADGGVFREPPVSKAVLDLPGFWEAGYQNGDVLVCKSSGGIAGNLMELILVKGYTHGGILNTDMFDLVPPNLPDSEKAMVPCVLSADVDYLQNYFELGNRALTYETYAGWAGANDVVTVLHSQTPLPTGANNPIGALLAGVYAKNGLMGTVYAFMGYPGTPYGAFQAIPRGDDLYWYCSKVPWRVYDAKAVNLEDASFYQFLNPKGRWTVFQESLLYKLYRLILWKCAGIPWFATKYYANQAIIAALGELITPDELRAYDHWFGVQTYGIIPDFDNCWGGW